MRKREKTKKKVSKKKLYASRRGGLNAELSKMLDELESEPMAIDDMIETQGANISEYHRHVLAVQQTTKQPMNWTLSDFLCNKYLIERENMMKAALESSKLITSLCQGSIRDHPFTLVYKKLIGLEGYPEPTVATCAYLCSLKDNLDKEIQIGMGINLYFQQVVEFLKKSFKNVSIQYPVSCFHQIYF